MRKQNKALHYITRCGVLSAIAIILFMPLFEIPVIAFYKLDFSTLPAILAGFAMGPVQAAVVILIKDLFHLTMSSTGGIGELADFLMSCAYVIPASMIYHFIRNRKGALLAMACGTVFMTVIAAFVNRYVMIPLYANFMPIEEIIAMGTKIWSYIDSQTKLILFITAPFNILKGTKSDRSHVVL